MAPRTKHPHKPQIFVPDAHLGGKGQSAQREGETHARSGRRSLLVLLAGLALFASAISGCGSDSGGGDSGKATTPDKTMAAPTSSSGGTAKSAVKVDIRDFKFVPDPIRVKAGGSVTWANGDSAPHTAETEGSKPSAFGTGTLKQGDTRRVTFAKTGRFRYFCSFHRFMTGTVEVVG